MKNSKPPVVYNVTIPISEEECERLHKELVSYHICGVSLSAPSLQIGARVLEAAKKTANEGEMRKGGGG